MWLNLSTRWFDTVFDRPKCDLALYFGRFVATCHCIAGIYCDLTLYRVLRIQCQITCLALRIQCQITKTIVVIWHCIRMKYSVKSHFAHEIQCQIAFMSCEIQCQIVWFHENTVSNHTISWEYSVKPQFLEYSVKSHFSYEIQCQIAFEIQCQIAIRTVKYSAK